MPGVVYYYHPSLTRMMSEVAGLSASPSFHLQHEPGRLLNDHCSHAIKVHPLTSPTLYCRLYIANPDVSGYYGALAGDIARH